MERKLVSLPSFFVLLLVAGIAFLATPVVDVQAALTSGNTITVTRKTTAPATPANLTTAGNAVFTITFAQLAVKVTGEAPAGGSAHPSADGFGPEDIEFTLAHMQPDPASTTRPITAAQFAKADATPTAGQGLVFEVTVPVPSDVQGTLTVSVKPFAADSVEFEEAADPSMEYDGSTAVSGSITYDTRDRVDPTAAFAKGLNLDGTTPNFTAIGGLGDTDLFRIEITIADNRGIATSGAGAFVVSTTPATSDVKLTTTLATPPATPPTTDPSVIVSSWVKGTASATSVTHVVLIDPADGAASVKIEVMEDSVTDTASPANKIGKEEATVTLTIRPTVTITTTAADPIPLTTDEFEVTFQLSAEPATSGNGRFLADDVTVTNGTLVDSPVRDVRAELIIYTAMVRLPEAADRESPLTIEVAADRFQSNTTPPVGNSASNEVSRVVTVPDPDAGTPPPSPDTGGGDPIPVTEGLSGFSIEVTVPANGWVVLAKNPDNTGISGLTGDALVDIEDNAWVDLRNFFATNSGGTLSLVSTGRAVKDLVISELMWGDDAGMAPPNSSQWIELYNTTKSAITATVSLQFQERHLGATVPPVPANSVGPTTQAGQAIDKFSNWGQGNQYWRIVDEAGGTYGQSGKSTPDSVTSRGEKKQIVSMERKIDYAKVEKNDHDNDTGKNRNAQLSGVPDGSKSGSWQASKAPRGNIGGDYLGTPGTKQTPQIPQTTISQSVIFNEIANRSEDQNDWIELYNPGNADVQINNWVLSIVLNKTTDNKLFKFESDESIVVPAKGFLLVVNTDPSGTALTAGANVEDPDSKANTLPTKFYVNSGLKIPNENYLLVLRTEEKLKSDEKIVEIGGHIGTMDLIDDVRATQVWPLKNWEAIKTDDLAQNNDKTWVRDKGKNLDHGDAWKPDGGVTGLGIDRAATSFNSGTPGFDNGAVKDKVKDLTATNPVVISEIMLGRGAKGRSAQWIELYNPSDTQAVKLHNWRLEVENIRDNSEELGSNVKFSYTLTLPDVRIQPKQTVLIVSTTSAQSVSSHFPSDRLINIYASLSLRQAVGMSRSRDAMLSSIGFYMKLSDPDRVKVDEIGNIDSNSRNADPPAWTLPGGDLEDGGRRASMIRRKGTFGNGTEADAWISAAAIDGILDAVYFGVGGDNGDIGTPGYRRGGVLPVQLSSFYSKRNDAGAVIITWATESELDNAGFNILRSSSRSGEFTRINSQLIPGAGTTGEKNTYTWTDTSANPNVVYYYQIEDVSLDGAHRTLRTTRLRGHVGAHGKLTTKWGVLKSRD